MGFAALAQLFLPSIYTLLDRLFPDPAKAQEAKLAFQVELDKAAAQADAAHARIVESQSKVIVAEANSQSWMAANWRPFLMFFLMSLLANQYFLVPILKAFGASIDIPPLPTGGWDLLQLGMGGYIVGRSAERVMQTYAATKTNQAQAGVAAVVAAQASPDFNEDAFYARIKTGLGGSINQATFDMLQDALKKGRSQ